MVAAVSDVAVSRANGINATGLSGLALLTLAALSFVPNALSGFKPQPSAPVPAAAAVDPAQLAEAKASALCLTQAVYYEARGESVEGQEAVAQVVLNRTHAKRFPKTVCGVVFQGVERGHGCQFSFACDGSMKRAVSLEAWARSEAVAARVLAGQAIDKVGDATHYHTRAVAPGWSRKLTKLGVIGAHVFYTEVKRENAAQRA